MAAGSYFGHYAAVKTVFGNLGVDHRGNYFSSVFDYCNSGFVAGRFYR